MSDAPSYTWDPEPAVRGGQGEVRFGLRGDGLPVALKVAAPSAGAREALRREVRVLELLRATRVQGVVEILDTVDVGGAPGLVMPRYSGTLRDWLDALLDGPDAHSLREILERCEAIARALAAVHQVQLDGGALVHRDVKPENVLLDEEGRVHLADFGGALAIDGLAAVEMGLFGTPMWAPFDQILPGLAIPDPTWDTYALCVILYACLTGARPAYQADPRELLSPRGRRLYELARQAIEADGDHQRTLRAEFAAERQGTSAADIVSLTGRSALNRADRRVLDEGIDKLCDLAAVPEERRARLRRGLWSLLVRGLSPTSHPSPPNRFRDAAELADALQDLLEIAFAERAPALPAGSWLDGPAPAPDITVEAEDAPPSLARVDSPLWLVALALVVLVGGGWALSALLGHLSRPAAIVAIDARTVLLDGLEVRVAPFRLDRAELSRGAWLRCVDAGACELPAERGAEADAVAGVSFAQAAAYCAWAGGRLPTEAEWLAAAGPSLYPWGDAPPTCDHAVARGCAEAARPPDSAPLGATADGVVDLAGNVWEWARVGKGGDRGVLLGGSVTSPASELGARARALPGSNDAPALSGVRCAYDP